MLSFVVNSSFVQYRGFMRGFGIIFEKEKKCLEMTKKHFILHLD